MTAHADNAGDQTASMKSGWDARNGPNSCSTSSAQVSKITKIRAIIPNAITKKAQAPENGTSDTAFSSEGIAMMSPSFNQVKSIVDATRLMSD